MDLPDFLDPEKAAKRRFDASLDSLARLLKNGSITADQFIDLMTRLVERHKG